MVQIANFDSQYEGKKQLLGMLNELSKKSLMNQHDVLKALNKIPMFDRFIRNRDILVDYEIYLRQHVILAERNNDVELELRKEAN